MILMNLMISYITDTVNATSQTDFSSIWLQATESYSIIKL